jgi:hypothetical protein
MMLHWCDAMDVHWKDNLELILMWYLIGQASRDQAAPDASDGKAGGKQSVVLALLGCEKAILFMAPSRGKCPVLKSRPNGFAEFVNRLRWYLW